MLCALDGGADTVGVQRISPWWTRTHNGQLLLYIDPLTTVPTHRALGSELNDIECDFFDIQMTSELRR